MITKKAICLLFFYFCVSLVFAQHHHPTSAEYQWPADPLVKEKLDRWRDLKFGMIVHWGLYAEAGIIESCYYG